MKKLPPGWQHIVAGIALLAVGTVFVGDAQAATLAHWEADDTPGAGGANSANVTFTAPNISGSAVTISSGSNTIQTAVGTQSNSSLSGDPVFRVGGWDDATPTKFYAFDVDVTGESNLLTLDEMRFFAVHSGTNRAAEYQVDISTDGSLFTTAGSGTIVEDGSPFDWDEFSVDLTSLSLVDLTDPVSFRLYMFNNSDGSGATTSIDDIRIFGEVTAVPEPASVAIWCLLGLLGVGFVWQASRRKPKATS